MANHKYTNIELIFLRDNYPGKSRAELTKLFNEEFSTLLSKRQITSVLKRYGFINGLGGRFQKGHCPWNKGLKSVTGYSSTRFKTGHTPLNKRPILSERVNRYGYIEIKVANPNVWKSKHSYVWKMRHGDIPKNHVVIFADGNNRNFDIDNLLLVSRSELVQMNKQKLIFNDKELTKTGKNIATLGLAINQKKRGCATLHAGETSPTQKLGGI